jgi:hypothetical protein
VTKEAEKQNERKCYNKVPNCEEVTIYFRKLKSKKYNII